MCDCCDEPLKVAEQSLMAAQRIKDVFARNVAAGGGGRGGSEQANLNAAKRSSQFLASVFADHFAELEPSFDVHEFFLACCMTKTFIARMERGRMAHERKVRKVVDRAYAKAERVTGARVADKTAQ